MNSAAPVLRVSPGEVHGVRALAVVRGRQRLVEELSFSLPIGGYVELTGPNGSGKTSLLRTLAGLQPAAAGSVPASWQQQVFLFAEGGGFRPELGVANQLLSSLQLADVAVSHSDIDALLSRVGLLRLADQPVRHLSQGQVRRLMLGVMAASRRGVWLVDEPFNGMDAEALALFRDMLRSHLRHGGVALIATHRGVSDTVPELGAQLAGRIALNGKSAQVSMESLPPHQRAQADTASPAAASLAATAPDGWSALTWVLRREFALVAARPQDVAWPSVFFCMAVSLFPFGLGTSFLTQAAAGIFWISALFALLMASVRVFDADAACGALAQMRTAGLSLPAVVAGKLLATWLTVGLPVAFASLLLGLQYGLPGDVLLLLSASLALGMATLSAMACLFAALGLLARQAQVVTSLLAVPLFVPLVIFGSAVVTGAQTGASVAAPFLVLGGMALVSALAVPLVAARLLALALE